MSARHWALAVAATAALASAACDACSPSTIEPHATTGASAPTATEGGDTSPAPPTSAAPSTGSVATAPALDYLERTTRGADPATPLPMIVAIHGLGDRPESWVDMWSDFPVAARIILPRAPTPWHGGGSWFPYPPRSIESLGGTVRVAADGVARLRAELVRRRPTRGKPIVTGFSQGGFLAFALATTHPGEIAAALPLSGSLPPTLLPQVAPAHPPPVFAFHGDADPVVPIAPTRDAVAELRALGYPATLREYPGMGHTVSREVRRDLDQKLVDLVATASRSGDARP